MRGQSKREERDARRRAENGAKLIVLGFGMLLTRAFFGKSFSALMPVGLLLVAIGAFLLWSSRSNVSEPAAPNGPRPKAPWSPPRSYVPAPVDRTPTELLRNVSGGGPEFVAAETAAEPASWGPDVFRVIEWRRFEALVERLFQQAGFETKAQSHGADGGVDIWLYSRNQPGVPVCVVQCKHWQGKRVGVDKIRELRGVMASHCIGRGQFATTSTFTPDAIAFGKANSINLLDVDALLALIAGRTEEQRSELLRVALEGEYWKPTCVNCGIKLTEKRPRKGGNPFWGCSNYPRCKTTMNMRAL